MPDLFKRSARTKCGYVGGNSRGCGTTHPARVKDFGDRVMDAITPALETLHEQHENRPRMSGLPTHAARGPAIITIPPPPVRAPQPPAQPRLETNAERRARIAARAPAVKAAEDKPIASAGEDDENENADEHRHNEAMIAEGAKRSGEMPDPRSSFGTLGGAVWEIKP